VDDFAMKYGGRENAEHLGNALLHSYELTMDLGGTVYSGITLKWDYQNRICDISMPGYIANVIGKFQHDNPQYPQVTPSIYDTPVYGTKTQYATRDETPPSPQSKTMSQYQEGDRISFVLRRGSRSNSDDASQWHCK
jgi:hypothetical protein